MPRYFSMILMVAFSTMPALASEPSEWVRITNAEELNKTISGNTFLFRMAVTAFYRKDGNMVENDKYSNLPQVRKWKVDESGQLCYYIFSKPDRLIGCAVLDRASGDAGKFRITWPDSAGPKFLVQRVKEAPKKLLDVLDEKAGTLQ